MSEKIALIVIFLALGVGEAIALMVAPPIAIILLIIGIPVIIWAVSQF